MALLRLRPAVRCTYVLVCDDARSRQASHDVTCVVFGASHLLRGVDLRRSRVTDGHVSSGRTSFSCFLTGEKARKVGPATLFSFRPRA